jgi:beta-N-acetylhexosaminidase
VAGVRSLRRTAVPVLLVSILAAGSACAARPRAPARPGASASASTSPAPDPATRAAALVARLGEEDLVGQVLMPYAYGNDANQVTTASAAANRKYAGVATAAEMIARYRLGGLILVGWSADDPTASTNKTSNLDSPAQIRTLTGGLQAAAAKLPAGVPLLLGTDQEYGVVTRIGSGVVQLPSALAAGAAHDPALTEAAWRAAGSDLRALGINVDFAPDADVLGNTGGGVIGSRAFGSDPSANAEQAAAAVRGLQSAGVAATLKHFPGHGHTTVDSHTNLPVLTQDRAALTSGDLPPFVAGIAAGAGLVMSAHLDVRAVDPGLPASFSSKVLVDLLRGQLKFPGVVVTDALNMAPAQRWSPGEAAVRALVAGNDLLLMPPDLAAAQRGLLDALHAGRLSRARLVEAATRVLTLKLELAGTPAPDMSTVDTAADRAAAGALAAASVTVLRGPCRPAPLRGPVNVTASGGRERQRAWLTEALRAQGVAVGAGGTEVHLVGYGDGAGDLSAGAGVTVAMDMPYVLRSASSPVLLATFSSSQPSMAALAAVLAGKAGAPGRSPVAVAGLPRSTCG